jgi:hypothetical protein
MTRKMTLEQKAKMKAGRLATAGRPKTVKISPLKAIRLKCLDCCGTSDVVKFCTLDGVNSTRCSLWPFRFGERPQTVARGAKARFLDPHRMPPANVPQEECGKATIHNAPSASPDAFSTRAAAHGGAD